MIALAVLLLGSAAAFAEDSPAGRPEPAVATADSTRKPAQRDVIDLLDEWIFGRRVEPRLEGATPTGLQWSLLPSLSYNPVYGFAFGASATGAGFTGSGLHSRPSFVSLSGSYSTTGQVQALARGETSTPSGDWLLQADFRFLDTDRSTWGLGSFGGDQEEYPMHFRLYRAYATVYRRTAGSVYVGTGYHLDDFRGIEDFRAAEGEVTPFVTYSGPGVTRTRATGLSVNLLADTRDNLGNPSAGYFLRGSFRTYVKELGSDRHWQEFWVSTRLYPHVPPGSDNVLAFWIYGWLTFGPAPYLDLPAVGWDTYGRGGRGYLQGRIRSPNQIYLETEYRFGLTRDGLLGAVVFVNGTTSTNPETQTFGRLDPGGGAGLRIKFNKDSRTNLAADRAWGRGDSGGWFLGLSEVF